MKKEKKEKQKLTLGAVVLEPGSTKKYHTGSWRMFRPVIKQDKCIKCGSCWKVCPDAAIKNLPDGRMYIDYTYCKGCMICVNECPAGAIIKEVEEK
ncbi:MAG TPA: 4Fe-4S binding protein [archaeon]|nr:4Fe-4S binding protein [archaeon]